MISCDNCNKTNLDKRDAYQCDQCNGIFCDDCMSEIETDLCRKCYDLLNPKKDDAFISKIKEPVTFSNMKLNFYFEDKNFSIPII